jgi:DNA-binding response OmpR family regulator
MALPLDGNLETILVVEEHPALLKLVKRILEDAGFRVIPATSEGRAIRLEADFPGTIDLLLSDLTVTGTTGPSLAKKLKGRRPQMRMVLMCGYPGGAMLLLNYGWHYVEKPLVASVLVSKIKDVLRGETREQSTDQFNTLKDSRRPFGRISLDFRPAASSQVRRTA